MLDICTCMLVLQWHAIGAKNRRMVVVDGGLLSTQLTEMNSNAWLNVMRLMKQ